MDVCAHMPVCEHTYMCMYVWILHLYISNACLLYKLCIHAHSLHECVKESMYVGSVCWVYYYPVPVSVSMPALPCV